MTNRPSADMAGAPDPSLPCWPAELTDTTPLITGGILDSLATLKLIAFLEERFGITMQAHETDPEHLDTITLITQLVREKASHA